MSVSNQYNNLSPYAGEIMDLMERSLPFTTFHVWGRYVFMVTDIPDGNLMLRHAWALVDDCESVRIAYLKDEAGTAEFTTDEPAEAVVGMLIAAME